jgi:PAS domain S-box-containing protein
METSGSIIVDQSGEATGAVLSSRDVTDAKAAETALREREERLRLLTDNMNDMITQVDCYGAILYASPSVKSVLGYEPESRVGLNCLSQVHPEDRERVRYILEGAARGGRSRSAEYRYLNSQGEYIWLETVGSPLRGADGQVEGLVLSSRDVTERREAEDGLYDTRRKYRDIFDHANDAILIFDHQGCIQEANKVACQRLGYAYRELVGMNVTSIDSRFRDRDAAPDIERCLAEGHGVIETDHIAKDGTHRPVELNCTPITYGPDTALLCIARDVSERREAERRLRSSEHLLQQTQSTAHIGGYYIDLVEGTSEWTDEAFRVCGIDPIKERARRDEYLQLVLPQDREMVNQAWWELPERDVNVDFVYRLLTPDGRLRHIHNRGKMELDDQGDVIGIFGTIMDITDLKEAELKLKESQDLLAEAQKLSKTGSYRYDLGTWEVKWSEEMFRLFGRDPAGMEPSIEEYWSLVHPDDLPGFKSGLRRAVDNLSPFDLTYRVRVGDAHIIVHSAGKIVADDDGSPKYLIGTLTDITEKLQAEEDRRRLERRFRDIFDSANDILVIVDHEGRLIEANSVACRRLGYSREELLEASLFDIIEPSSRQGLTEAFSRLRGVSELLFESSHIGRDGTVIPVEISCKAVDIDGKNALLLVARDITERKDAERRLMESQRLLAEAERASKMGSFRVNLVTGQIQASEEFFWILGLDEGHRPLREHLTSTVHPEDRGRLSEAIERVRTGRDEVDLDYRMMAGDGTIKYVQARTRPEFGANGRFIGIFGTIMDVTERKRAEQAAKLAELKIALLGDITRHDVRNKVTALSGYLQLAEMRSTDPSARELLAKARLAANSITHQMAFAREYQALGQNEAHWLDLTEAFRRGVANLDLGRVNVHCALDGYEVFADPMLEKVFHNLVENSIRYGRTVTAVELSAAVTEGSLSIVCQDDGVGITEEDRATLFDWEFRGRRGHGLHLIGEVLRISGMSIRETGGSGRGSRFEIVVPSGRFRLASEEGRTVPAEKAPG